VRDVFTEMLNTQPDFTVVATASDGAEAVRTCEELHPDVVLMDVRMPGWTASRRLANWQGRAALDREYSS